MTSLISHPVGIRYRLTCLDGKSSKGRTYDEILTETAKHQDVPTYAAAYVSSLGVGKYLDLVENLGARNTHYSSPKGQVPANTASGGFDSEGAAEDVGVLGTACHYAKYSCQLRTLR